MCKLTQKNVELLHDTKWQWQSIVWKSSVHDFVFECLQMIIKVQMWHDLFCCANQFNIWNGMKVKDILFKTWYTCHNTHRHVKQDE